tara:strand:+ start:6968 stop:7408 length:441 start_codon:yes stop_codon:yes gene_type:complete
MEKIAVGCDHAGFALKTELLGYLEELGYQTLDLGTHSNERVDYPDYGAAVGQAVSEGKADLGLLVCGSGIGIGMAANKISGIRAATVHDVTSAHLAREHNNANIICFGERLIGPEIARESLVAFLNAEFQGGRHAGRVQKISDLES